MKLSIRAWAPRSQIFRDRYCNLLAVAWFLSVFGAAICFAAPSGQVTIYMSPSGNDAAPGTDADHPIQTLARAQEILKAIRPVPGSVEIRVADGTYSGQSVIWNWIRPGTRIDIRGADAAHKPVFDGVNNSTNWLEVQGGSGQPTNITIEGLEIRNYLTAIWFHGDRIRQDDRWTGGNVIRNNRFESIGSKDPTGKTYSAFAIGIMNSRSNLIEGNQFHNIVSTKNCTWLHSIYAGDGASKNIIRDNLFDGGCGDTISVRDNSNDNVIENNTFRRQRTRAILLEWYCSRTAQSNCTKPGVECPSWGNVLSDNVIEAGADKPAQFSYVAVPQTQPGCEDKSAATPRVSVRAGNRVR